MLGAAEQELQRGRKREPLVEATLRRSLAESYVGLRRFDDARRQMSKAWPVIGKLGDDGEVAQALMVQAALDESPRITALWSLLWVPPRDAAWVMFFAERPNDSERFARESLSITRRMQSADSDARMGNSGKFWARRLVLRLFNNPSGYKTSPTLR